MPDFKEALTRKIGPLPVWAWGGVVGGGLLVAKALTGGGSGASVSPQSLNAATGELPDLGDAAGAGSAVTNPLGYVTLPDGTIVLDRPSSDLTIIPNTPTTPPATTPAPVAGSSLADKLRAVIAQVIALRKAKPIAARQWARSHPAPKGESVRQRYNRLVSERKFLRNAKGDTSYAAAGNTSYAQGDTTPGARIVTVPSMPPLPIGNVLALPTYDVQSFRGPTPTFSTTPIASAARIAMPPINGETTGSVVVPRIPDTRGRNPARRLLDPVYLLADQTTPHTPPTTFRPRLRIATRVRTRIDTVARRNVSG